MSNNKKEVNGKPCIKCVLIHNTMERLLRYTRYKPDIDGVISDKGLNSFFGEVMHIQKEKRNFLIEHLIFCGHLVKVGKSEGGMHYKINY